jgi:hypothetical protein
VVQLGLRFAARVREIPGSNPGDPTTFGCARKDIVEALEEYGVRLYDVMANVRRYGRKGLVYVGGYKMDERQTPFKKGFLITWIDQDLPRDEALEERTSRQIRHWMTRQAAVRRWRGGTGPGTLF